MVMNAKKQREERRRSLSAHAAQVLLAGEDDASAAPTYAAPGASSLSSSATRNILNSTVQLLDRQDVQQQSKPATMALQKIGLGRAAAPTLPQPVAPHAKSERKRALAAASYYSECFLHGISASQADQAAVEAQERYQRWWVQSKAHGGSGGEEAAEDDDVCSGKRRRTVKECELGKDDLYEPKHSDDVASIDETALVTFDSSNTSSAAASSSMHRDPPTVLFTPQQERLRMRPRFTSKEINGVKFALIKELKQTGGDTTTDTFHGYLNVLHSFYETRGTDARWNNANDSDPASSFYIDGTWLTLSKPNYSDCQGRHARSGDCVYSLGRLAFDMFRPTNLNCSIQGVYNAVSGASHDDDKLNDEQHRPRSFPFGLASLAMKGERDNEQQPVVRNYDIIVALTIEPGQTRYGKTPSSPDEFVVPRPIRGLLTNQGYMVPDPHVPNRLTVWFSGGALEVHDEQLDLHEWKRIFDETQAPWRDLGEYARVLAARCLLGAHLSDGMDGFGTMSYQLKRPIGGHGSVYIDVLYSDNTMRIVRGHQGSIFVCIRSS